MFFGEFSELKLGQAFYTVFVLNVIGAVWLARREKLKKKAVMFLCLFSIPLSLISGAYIGTLHGHGISLPWPIFGTVISIAGLLLGLVIIGLMPRVHSGQNS
ncbi:hypothetical protein MNBD_GAMMA10-2796 [hydrothermal vent metagenome]|uniref:Uncharacterized protein n=1 Tax=hydrothermal vent metagenome TaxID=652676 RepID=A0A3B0XH36_9ZZZZ